jgi:ankyrin repeat protein
MIQPVEMCKTLPMTLHGGAMSTTTEVWEMLRASREGNLERVMQLVSQRPELSTCQYNYTPPIHFAVREGHLALVRALVEQRAFDPEYKTYPFGDSLLTMAQDRGYDEIAMLIQEALGRPELTRKLVETGGIVYGQDDDQKRFDKAVHAGNLQDVEHLWRPALIWHTTSCPRGRKGFS